MSPRKLPIIDPEHARHLAALAIRSSKEAAKDLDLFGIMWMEHINLVVGNRRVAETFYMDTLGCTQDGKDANIGMQQFHIGSEDSENPQVLNGVMGLVLPDLKSLKERLTRAENTLCGTEYAWEDNGEFVSVSCPWGNIFCIWDTDTMVDGESQEFPTEDMPKMQSVHLNVEKKMSVRPRGASGGVGIRFVSFFLEPDKTSQVAYFYQKVLNARTTISANGLSVAVCAGPTVDLIFTHNKERWLADDWIETKAKAKGIHICIYVTHFSDSYHCLLEKSIVWTNPRFTALDRCDTFQEAINSRQYRFKSVVDENGTEIMELEHETRSCRHSQYMKHQKWIIQSQLN